MPTKKTHDNQFIDIGMVGEKKQEFVKVVFRHKNLKSKDLMN